MKLALPSLRDGCGGFNSAESILCTHLKCEASIPYLTKVEGTYADSTPYSNEVGGELDASLTRHSYSHTRGHCTYS